MAALEIEKLWIAIEQLREKLYAIVNREGIKSPAAIQASQRLDNVLNKYDYFKK